MFGFEKRQRRRVVVTGDAGIGTLSAVRNIGFLLLGSLCPASRQREDTQDSKVGGSTDCLEVHAHIFFRLLPAAVMSVEPGSPVDYLPGCLVKLECVYFVHNLDVGNASRTVANTTGLDLRRNHAAIRCLGRVEVATVLPHMLDFQFADMTG